MKKLFIDFDNTIVNSSKAYCKVYNDLFKNMYKYTYIDWKDIQEYNIMKYCTLANKFSKSLFDTENFFKELEFIDNDTKNVLRELCRIYDVSICTIGTLDNIYHKSKWIKENLPFIKNCIFITQGKKEGIIKHDKSMIDMSNSIFIDDNLDCLDSSNAKRKFVFGRIVEYNINSNYTRILNWAALYTLLYHLNNTNKL